MSCLARHSCNMPCPVLGKTARDSSSPAACTASYCTMEGRQQGGSFLVSLNFHFLYTAVEACSVFTNLIILYSYGGKNNEAMRTACVALEASSPH